MPVFYIFAYSWSHTLKGLKAQYHLISAHSVALQDEGPVYANSEMAACPTGTSSVPCVFVGPVLGAQPQQGAAHQQDHTLDEVSGQTGAVPGDLDPVTGLEPLAPAPPGLGPGPLHLRVPRRRRGPGQARLDEAASLLVHLGLPGRLVGSGFPNQTHLQGAPQVRVKEVLKLHR